MSNPFSAAVPNFRPSRHGFKFTNNFPLNDLPFGGQIERQINQSGYGLCGGMAHCVHELFNFNESVPTTTKPPKVKTGLYYYLAQALGDSFGPRLKYMNKILAWHAMPNGAVALPKLTVKEYKTLKTQLKLGQLVQLMICYNTGNAGDPWGNHQVLAYKMEEKDGAGKIWIYEPNNPGSDNAHIEYTIDAAGVHMNEINPSGSSQGPKTIHGFFVVFPKLDNPMTRPSYLIHKGTWFYVKHAKNIQRQGIFTIVKNLKKYTKLTPADIAKLLKRAGYSALDIARISKTAFKLSAQAALNLLFQLGFTARQIVAAINMVYRKAAGWLIKELLRRGGKPAEIAVAIQKHFRMQLVDLAKTLRKAGVSIGKIVKIMRSKFRISNIRTLAKMLRSAGFSVNDIIKALKGIGMSVKDAIIILRRDFKYSAANAAKTVVKFFGKKTKAILIALWKHGNVGFNDLRKVASSVFDWGIFALRKII